MKSQSDPKTLAASADCSATPSAPATVNVMTNVDLKGTHTYTVTNPDNSSIDVTIEVILEDSKGHSYTNSKPLKVPAKSQNSGQMSSFLTTSYDNKGDVTVTARTKVDGGAFCSTASGQNMKVV